MIALATTAVAWIVALVLTIGWIFYAASNVRASRRELGSEVELAANRKPYYDDEVLEGRRLELVQLIGVLLLVVIVIGLPLYWVFEPSRQAGAREAIDSQFVGWGAELFASSADGGFNCAGCHGGMTAVGGNAPFTVTDPTTGEVRSVTWTAPALNSVFYRFDREEVRYVLNYGRPGSPMSAWGLPGGGPMNAQQIDTLMDYIESIQVPPEGCDDADPDCPTGHLPTERQEEIEAAARRAVEEGRYATYGEALFNLDLSGGAYSCARCHTPGWSYGDPGESGSGALGWNLTGGATNAHFPLAQDMVDFITVGSENGVLFGRQGQGSGRMPGFGGMLTQDQIEAIVEYVRGL